MRLGDACVANTALTRAERRLSDLGTLLEEGRGSVASMAKKAREALTETNWELVGLDGPKGFGPILRYVFQGNLDRHLRMADRELVSSAPIMLGHSMPRLRALHGELKRMADGAGPVSDLRSEIEDTMRLEETACMCPSTVVFKKPLRALRKKFE